MKEPYVNPGEDDSLDAALDAENALETEIIDPDNLPESEDDEDVEDDEDESEEEGELPEDWDPDAWDQEDPNDD